MICATRAQLACGFPAPETEPEDTFMAQKQAGERVALLLREVDRVKTVARSAGSPQARKSLYGSC